MKKPFTPEDMKKLTYLSWPSISPDGSVIAYVASQGDEKDGSFRSEIRFACAREGTIDFLEKAADYSQDMPEYLPDGSLLFVTDETGEKQLFLRDRKGNKKQLTSARHGIGHYAVSRDGSRAAFELTLWPEERSKGMAFTVMTPEEKTAWEEDLYFRPYEIEELTYKMDEWYGMRKGEKVYIGFVDIGSGAQHLAYEETLEACLPSLSFDGRELAFYGYPHGGANGRRVELFVQKLTIGEPPRQLTDLTDYYYPLTPPLFADGGESVIGIYVNGDDEFTPIKINCNTQEVSIRYELNDASHPICHGVAPIVTGRGEIGNKKPAMQLSADGETMYFISSWHGIGSLYQMPVDGFDTARIVVLGQTDVQYFALSECGEPTTVMGNVKQPAELYWEGQPLTSVNEWLTAFELPETEHFTTPSEDGKVELDVWLLHPAGQEEGKKYPAVLDIHGGPDCTYDENFWHEFYALSGAGNAVIYTNPRGSTGYGGEFCEGNISWSDTAVSDLLTAVDACIEKGFIDENRIGVTGGSYGGYMTNKLIIRTKRFAAAVSQRSLINTATSYGTGDMGFISCTPGYEKVSMLDYLTDRANNSLIGDIDNVTTPTLILHARKDYRCSFEQAEQFFVSMKERNPKVPVRLVMFPEENHGLTRTGNLYNQVRHLQEMVDWFRKYLTEEAETQGAFECLGD